MFQFLLLLLLFAVLYPLVRVWLVMRRVRNGMREMMETAAGRTAAEPKEAPRRRYAEDEGSYVEFEDLPDDGTTTTDQPMGNDTAAQPRIIDADFEDL